MFFFIILAPDIGWLIAFSVVLPVDKAVHFCQLGEKCNDEALLLLRSS